MKDYNTIRNRYIKVTNELKEALDIHNDTIWEDISKEADSLTHITELNQEMNTLKWVLDI